MLEDQTDEMYDALVEEYERQFPEIDPNSRQFDSGISDALVQRIGELVDGGARPEDALIQTMNEYQTIFSSKDNR